MLTPLSVLVLQDHTADLESIAHALHQSGFEARCQRVETESDFAATLRENPDVILLDHAPADFDNLRAIEVLQEAGLAIPYIILTGVVNDRMVRLGPAIRRALEEGELRRQQSEAKRALRQKNIQLEEQYRHAQSASRMKSMFLTNMSHELRTPLTAVIGFSELLLDGKVGALTAEQLDFMRDILANGKHLLNLINDVLDLARVESGLMTFRPEQVCLPDLIRESVAAFRLLTTERQMALVIDVQMSAIEVFIDPQKLKQVLLNYLSNALKFTPAGGTITVRTRMAEDSFLRLEVEDTGIGIATDDIRLLFQDFHHMDGGVSKDVQGTGLGLALTKRLVEAQGGKVGVVSVLGKGCMFFADLPCSPERTIPSLEALSSATLPSALVPAATA